MRKLTSKKNEQRKKQFLIGILLIVIMFGSAFAIVGNSFRKEPINTDIDYNGFKFVKQNNFWLTQVDNQNLVFSFNPTEVKKINSKVNKINQYNGQPLYYYSDKKEAEIEIRSNLDPLINKQSKILRMQQACFDNETCKENLPEKDCQNNFIIIKESNITDIIQNNSCVYIYDQYENLTKTTDEFLFKLYGIEQ